MWSLVKDAPGNVMAPSTLREPTSKKYGYQWDILNFAEMRGLKDVVNVQYRTFKVGKDIGIPTKWKVYLQMKEGGDIVVHLKLLDYPKHLNVIHSHINVVHIGFFGEMNQELHKNLVGGYEQGFHFEYLTHDTRTDKLTHKGTLKLGFIITLFNLGSEGGVTSLLGEYEPKFLDQVRGDLACTPPDKTSPTLRIVSKDGKQFKVNPFVMAARCPSMIEGRSGSVVQVEDLDSEALEVLLDFCKKGTLQENWKEKGVIEGLLYGAHKYEFEDLKEFLGKALPLFCTPDNCGKLVKLARSLEMKEVEGKLLDYFKRNMVSSLEDVSKFMEDATRGLEKVDLGA